MLSEAYGTQPMKKSIVSSVRNCLKRGEETWSVLKEAVVRKCRDSIKMSKNVDSCLFGQGHTVSQAYHVCNKYGQVTVKLCVEGGMNFAQTIGSTPMTMLHLTGCSWSSSLWQQRIYTTGLTTT
jgi:hypothetical protein